MTLHRTLMLDVGGTFIKCSDGRSVPVDSDGSREDIVSSLHLALHSPVEYDRVSVAIPGPFDYSSGIFRMEHKFAAVKGESFSSLALGGDECSAMPAHESGCRESGPCGGMVQFRYIHDVNCMLLGEMTCGNARGCRNVALVSLGTGLGFAVCRDGKILTNEAGSPAVSIYRKPYGDGILEDYVSKRGFLRGYADGMTVKGLAEAARSGDADAVSRFLETGHILGSCIADILRDNGIECLLFGGQISRSFDLFAPAVREELADVGCLSRICAISDFDNATFNGLQSLWNE